jgi:hypothetical protein
MVRFPSGSQTGAKGRRMSEATKDTVPAQTAGDQDMQAPRDSTPPLSAEEADLVASQFKPAWETVLDDSPADLEARGQAPDSTHAPESSQAEPAAAPLESDETQPPQTTQSPALPEEQGQEDVGEPQGPVDIIAAIPKRTEIEIKDEPTVVVPEDDPFEPAPVVPVATPARAQEDHDSDRQQRQRRNRMIVVAVVAIAAVIGGIGGLKLVLSGDDEPSATGNMQHDPADKATSVESLPVAPDEPAAPPEPTAIAEPAATEPTPSPDDTVKPTAEPVAAPPPDKTGAGTKTAPRSTEGTAPTSTKPATTTPATTAPEPTKPAEPKPPKTTSPPATDKPPSGGIVRETPF